MNFLPNPISYVPHSSRIYMCEREGEGEGEGEREMAGLFDKQADIYKDARPQYPSEWYSLLAALTPNHNLAWDVGTGNGQAAVGVAEHYTQVIATDVSEAQLKRAIPHPKVRYVHTPLSLGDEEVVSLVGGEGSVDLVTSATAVHWFDLPKFYSIVTRVLRKPGGILAIWCYSVITLNPTFDSVMKKFVDSTRPFWDSRVEYAFDGYHTLPFPFESVGLGSQGNPISLDMHKELSFDGVVGWLRSWSPVNTAKAQSVDLLSESMIKEFEFAWGGSSLIQQVNYKTFMLVGTPKSEAFVA